MLTFKCLFESIHYILDFLIKIKKMQNNLESDNKSPAKYYYYYYYFCCSICKTTFTICFYLIKNSKNSSNYFVQGS